jgi:hypothetical protein
MEIVAYAAVALVSGVCAYAAYRARQQKNTGGYTAPGKPNPDRDPR